MSSTNPARRVLAALAVATVATTVAAAVLTTASSGADAAERDSRTPARTTVTFLVPDCSGCRITLHQAIEGKRSVWESKEKRATDGRVRFRVATKHTRGLDATIRGPWEGAHSIPTGYVSQVVFRYGHERPGSTVSTRAAKAKSRASACWAGTDATNVTIPLEVRKVSVQGTTGRTHGTLAWTSTTQDYWGPMERTGEKGIFGTQDVPFCARP